MVPVIVIAGGGIFAFIKFKDKKKAEETKSDPDANYNDELDEEDDEYDFFDDEAIVDDEGKKLRKRQSKGCRYIKISKKVLTCPKDKVL